MSDPSFYLVHEQSAIQSFINSKQYSKQWYDSWPNDMSAYIIKCLEIFDRVGHNINEDPLENILLIFQTISKIW